MTDEEKAREACFETGIKLGALYHQFIGTPVSEDSVASLEEAVEEAVGSQRYVVDADVSVEGVEHNRFGYDELEGTMLDVRVTVEKDGVRVEATMGEEDGYPMMRIDGVRDV
ncbi:MAG: hypothetical protein ACI9QA_000288 [Methanobacteriota archaeon]|uniref:Dihydroneopterin aldolase MtpD C-terminal domain-containing protein n=1 Tax=Halorutilus salinus TaxID=2487751 RepID=A0A9Q4C3D9_9EURY|nr:hypothetical protein [Halorutilus salinus]